MLHSDCISGLRVSQHSIFLRLSLASGIIWVLLEVLGIFFITARPNGSTAPPGVVVGNGGGLKWYVVILNLGVKRLVYSRRPPWDIDSF